MSCAGGTRPELPGMAVRWPRWNIRSSPASTRGAVRPRTTSRQDWPGQGNDLAREVAKDRLVLDFLGLTEDAQEHAIEEAMTLRMAQTLAEFGPGFAFIGRQYHLDVDGDDFFIDLLLYHVPSDRYVS
ncbi:putative nuclease of restriction endonuclease-like (RecB) superfamily [Arthrobacter sp. MP_M7]|nr:putative nuclease of restriction endonuclease-like (RecB) superfamily [Arthrobacter sp. MP_M4]MEC5204563.1 putative nuclease of restriction endonuclease-like (RecB) superfamily [Arthrobacter sp. MP_M7]